MGARPELDAGEQTPPVLPTLESVLCTEELNRRPSRPPDHERESRALVSLALALADSPHTILQTLADKIREVFRADSAGVSLVTEDGKRFYWPAITGVWKPHIGGGTPRDFGPCGDVLDRNSPLLFSHFERHVFAVFVQVDTAWQRAQGGLGIGLSLVKEFVALHGGRVEARSDGPGKGSEFVVRLPTTTASSAVEPTTAAVEGSHGPRCRVLVVDDNRDAAESLAEILGILGHEVRTAHDGEAGVAVAAEFRPEVVLMDLGMPKVDGYETARRIRAEPWGRAGPRGPDRVGGRRRPAADARRRVRPAPGQAGGPDRPHRTVRHPAHRTPTALRRRAPKWGLVLLSAIGRRPNGHHGPVAVVHEPLGSGRESRRVAGQAEARRWGAS